MQPVITPTSTDADDWDSHIQHYEATIGRWLTFPICQDLIGQVNGLSSFDAAGASAFDNGCGTGAVTRLLVERFPGLPIVATDISPAMVRHLARLMTEAGQERIHVRVADALALDLPDDSFTHSLSTAMIGSTSDPLHVAKEMFRVTKPGSIIGISSYVGHYFPSLWQKAVCTALDRPEYVAPKMMDPLVDSPEGLKSSLEKAGWDVVESRTKHLLFGWKSTEEAMRFFFDHGNPLVGVALRGMEEHVESIRPEFERVFEKAHPDPATFYETGILAVAKKSL